MKPTTVEAQYRLYSLLGSYMGSEVDMCNVEKLCPKFSCDCRLEGLWVLGVGLV
jgi:hypothetical protein